MPNLFDEFDLEMQKINMDIMLLGDSCSDSLAHCSSGSGSNNTPSNGPTCWNVCN